MDPLSRALAAYLENRLGDYGLLVELRSQGFTPEGAREQLDAIKQLRDHDPLFAGRVP